MTVVKSCYWGTLPVNLFRHLCCTMCHLVTNHNAQQRRTDRRTDRRTALSRLRSSNKNDNKVSQLTKKIFSSSYVI